MPEGARSNDLTAEISACLDAPGEISARDRAGHLAQRYRSGDRPTKETFLRTLAQCFGPGRDDVDRAIQAVTSAVVSADRVRAEASLRTAMAPPYERLLQRFTTVPGGVKLLVDMRSDLMQIASEDAALGKMEDDLKDLLASWFDFGFLTLSRISWDSPASLLDKVIAYEAVHEIHSWDDLRNRLDSDRRCYALFHPAMPSEPLAFVEVALVSGVSRSVQRLLDQSAPVGDPERADTAIFYSISNTQKGLRGISFGEFLIKRVVDELSHELPKLRTYATLSPIPGFRVWLDGRLSRAAKDEEHPLLAEERAAVSDGTLEPSIQSLRMALGRREGPGSQVWRERLQDPLLRLCARYFAERRADGKPLDPVARFHLGNGALIDRINWMGDTSRKGLRQSHGMMVNYRYDLDALEEHQAAYENERNLVVAAPVARLIARSGLSRDRIREVQP